MLSLQSIFYLVLSLLGIEVALVIAILVNKVRLSERAKTVQKAEGILINRYFKKDPLPARFPRHILASVYVRLTEQIQFTPAQKDLAFQDFSQLGIISLYLKNINSPFILQRKTAIFYLSYFLNPETRAALVRRMRMEKIGHVRIFLVNALKNDMDQLTVQSMIESVVGSRRFYQSRVIEIIKSYLLSSHSFFPDIYNRPEVEIKEFFVDVAGSVFREDFRRPLYAELAVIERHLSGVINPVYAKMRPVRVGRLYHHILSVLSDVYGLDLENELYLQNPDPEVVEIAVKSMAKTKTFDQIRKILLSADGSANDSFRVFAITRIIETNKIFYDQLIDLIGQNLPDVQLKIVVRTLTTRVEYLILKVLQTNKKLFAQMIGLIIDSGSTADLIGFINKNKDAQVQADLLHAIKPHAQNNPVFLADLNEYLLPELFQKLGYIREKKAPVERPKSKSEKSKTVWLIEIIVIAFAIFPLSYLLINLRMFGSATFLDVLKMYIVLMNELFVFYYITVNAVYLILAAFSWVGARRQSQLWSIKSNSMLFEKGMLSSISIIAPAYNEEMSIVESVESLLNLNYPDFEVVVVNDGSKDQTLAKMIEHFQLDRKNVMYEELLRTRPVKAIYKNKKYPNLTVVDKQNGGKADALNVGINVSKNDYICGIDADSILESESLLRLMSSMLDHDEITLALGGNIFPVNGCVVDHGQIESKGLPKQWLARLQSIEYLRAFSLGRIGWSVMNSLLIVSGAFGLFEKQILIECGGYLTQSTKDKDTVGEDMELVVRITRQAYDTHLKFRVDYIHNAVCYTEVPEETKSLLKQRNRWQRGLVDILSYHRKMIFNHRYKNAGLIGTPYFFLFEMVGPLLEMQGYVALFLGLIFNVLTLEIVLLLGVLTFLMGIIMSLLALLVTERDSVALDFKDTIILLVIAIVENFGWRQFIALYRVKGIFSSLRETNAWGTVKRVGFKK